MTVFIALIHAIVIIILFPPIIGQNANTLLQYSTSLDTPTSYIANINITDNSLRGKWTITLRSQGSYSIQVLGTTELSFSNELYKIDPTNTYGFSKIDGKPTQGTQYHNSILN